MKRIFLFALFCTSISTALLAQPLAPVIDKALPALDKSPLDVSYYPNNYTLLKNTG